jgi:Zn-dependent protease
MTPATFIALALQVVIVNIALGSFNMIPIPPLDGSKVLFSFLPYRWSRIRWQLERYALVLVFIIILIPAFTTGTIYGCVFPYYQDDRTLYYIAYLLFADSKVTLRLAFSRHI